MTNKNYLFSIETWLYEEIKNSKPKNIKRLNIWMQKLLVTGLQVKLNRREEELLQIKNKLEESIQKCGR